MPSIEIAERELPLIQRGIVDNCFEEGHYEYGIGVLDRLRGQRYKPVPLHMRQLLYISLYPPPPRAKRLYQADAPPPSPQKVQLQRQKDDLWPKPASRPLAIALLEAFASTNTPESLMRGFPFYTYKDNDGVLDVDPFRDETIQEEHTEDNSPLRKEVLAIRESKDYWGLLRSGFVRRKQVDRTRLEDADTAALEAEEDCVIGPYAWSVLEWLINVFEKDEQRAEERGQAPHSALLLCQIPPPGSKKGPRWDVDTPLKVVCACISPVPRSFDRPHKYASSQNRFDLGTRLLTLLVNLTLTRPPLLSPTHFVRSLVSHFRELPLVSVETLFSAIPANQASFKVSFLESYISEANGSSSSATRRTSGAPVPRAKPKFTGKGASKEIPTSTAASMGQQDNDKDPYPMPSRDSLLSLLSSPLPPLLSASHHATGSAAPNMPSLATKLALAKFHLVSTLCTLYLSQRLADARWAMAIQERKLHNSIRDGFALQKRGSIEGEGQIIQTYMSSALEMAHVWELSGRSQVV